MRLATIDGFGHRATCDPLLSPLSRTSARQGRRVADSAHVPRSGLRPALLLDFAASATRRPWREGLVTPKCRTATEVLGQAGGALRAAKSRRRRRPQAGAGGHERSRVPRRPDLAALFQSEHVTLVERNAMVQLA